MYSLFFGFICAFYVFLRVFPCLLRWRKGEYGNRRELLYWTVWNAEILCPALRDGRRGKDREKQREQAETGLKADWKRGWNQTESETESREDNSFSSAAGVWYNKAMQEGPSQGRG